ncbi:tRNA glutamyl-Q(34) synthetase GluQRS [Dongia soli]|uniref:tRNA glutamyl-Q(34) synthetase GluQRS n=1 Tax=Dongia soli TaxID=600628 RepID=A0ABU5E4N3_9PROT|nr:tRNA glutamyl-Q(34) synthetase GluQRS [Dongia soli]MDY0881221.1 tRNA glutamyl-Q(34) synthetase GluQRS [Dongia soli]
MIVTRFAPSPTGYLHLGHLHSALIGWQAARQAGGRFLLRIEDIDTARCRPEFEQAIIEDLGWLGLDWDGPIRRQSDHLDDYRGALAQLGERGLIYPCFCSRKDILAAASAPHDVPSSEGPIYPGTCRYLPAHIVEERQARGDPYALRFDSGKAAALAGPLAFEDQEQGTVTVKPDLLGDVVLARRDAPASYHLCVTMDDHLQGVTLVTRGVDLFSATHVHRLLQAVLGLAVPVYRHHLLLTNAQGQRLSKRDGALSLRQMREDGLTAAEIRKQAGKPASVK